MRFFWLVLILALCTGPMAGAKTVSLASEQASVDIPDTWIEQSPPANASSTVIVTAISAEKKSMVQVQAFPNPRGALAAQPDLVTNIKNNISNQYVAHGGQVQFTGESKVDLSNVPAYVIQYTVTMPSGPALMARSYQLAANGKLYLITLRTVDAGADADLQAIANSFHFDSPPTLPTPQVAGHRIRYYLAAAGGVVVLVALGAGFYYYRQRQLYE